MGERTVQPLGWRGWLGCLTALGVVLGLLYGAAWVFLHDSGYWPGSSMTTAWEAPYDRNATDQGNRAWLVDDTVVRSRVDAVTGYDVRSGRQRWEYVPGRADICSTSPTADDGVALLFYGEPRKGCHTLAGLDLRTGRELWHTTATGAASLQTGAKLGVWLDRGARPPAVRAVDLRTGAARRPAAVPKGCTPTEVTAAARQVLALAACGAELKLVAFSPADGGARWTVPVDARRGVSTGTPVTFLSADPAVVRVGDPDSGGPFSYRAFGPDGRPQGVIDGAGGYGEITRATVADGRLFAVATYTGNQDAEWERLVAFDLGSGTELWSEHVASGRTDTAGLAAGDGRVTVLTVSSKWGDRLLAYAAADGDEEDDRAFRDHIGGGALFTYDDLVVVFRHGTGVRPFSAYERW